MKKYFVNKNSQNNGDHEVHSEDCDRLPNEEHSMYLGEFPGCHEAVTKARNHYWQSNGCFYCSRECNTG